MADTRSKGKGEQYSSDDEEKLLTPQQLEEVFRYVARAQQEARARHAACAVSSNQVTASKSAGGRQKYSPELRRYLEALGDDEKATSKRTARMSMGVSEHRNTRAPTTTTPPRGRRATRRVVEESSDEEESSSDEQGEETE